MCGRFTVRTAPKVKLDHLRNPDLPFEARFNITPTQEVMVIADFGNGLELTKLVWGLIPSWSTDGKGFINARAETLELKPSFSESFEQRRCLIPADGFFEWKRSGRAKQPYFIQLVDGSPFSFAGIWDRWRTRDPITSCAIITTTANGILKPLHDRMPVILKPEQYEIWLDPNTPLAVLKQLLAPLPDAEISFHPVGSAVNDPKNDTPNLIDRVDHEIGTTPSLF
jgi:putative SOS response-associated peptidase YedK